ncbi:MAG: hypothetical protein IKZ41_07145 [Clostridia bacterium]|nr:hypothetical protein [Clostridia bacterium]MBR5367557.1 hypothetical protein [Clostridia bacterium]
MKKHLLLLLPALCVLLASCALLDRLGFDTYDYMSEPVLRSAPADGEEAAALEDLLDMLITDSEQLPTFERMGDAIREYRDAVLTWMLKSNYMKYSGNTALIQKAEQAYPEYHITQIIPEGEFEATMYRCFGGDVKITHKNGDRFYYLPKVNAYISPVMPEDSGLRAHIVSLDETNRTWRIRFQVLPEGGKADRDTVTYFALVIKREDGTLYIKKLLTEEEMKASGNGFFRKKEA